VVVIFGFTFWVGVFIQRLAVDVYPNVDVFLGRHDVGLSCPRRGEDEDERGK
jgi:hypothetical protein